MHQAQPLERGRADVTDDRTHTRHDTERVRPAARVLLDAAAGLAELGVVGGRYWATG
jgi:hypothetical protein